MARYRLDISYDGTGFRGFARQPHVRTVQGVVEEAIATVTGVEVDSTGAGRTDAGVHARQQVMTFESPTDLDPERLTRSVTRMLEPEVVVRRCRAVEDSFDARFSAVKRSYKYQILDGPTPDPLRRFTTWHVSTPLDIDRMHKAVQHLIGEHDFASFCRRRQGATTVRTVTLAAWVRQDDLAVMMIEARAFCHQMVRSIVGLAADVGRGKIEPGDVPAILTAEDRGAASQIAPPHGLILWEIDY